MFGCCDKYVGMFIKGNLPIIFEDLVGWRCRDFSKNIASRALLMDTLQKKNNQ
jgi:hypothetical protein